MQQPRWLDAAWPEMDVREVAGSRSNPRIAAFFRDAGHSQVTSDETAWCAAFVGACLARGGEIGTRSLLARSYLEWGEAVDGFRLGAIAVLSRGTDPAQGHVGFLVGMTERSVVLLGGNQSDAVTIDAFDRQRLIGLRWPSAAEAGTSRVPDVAAADFGRCLAHVLEMEGGWTDDPQDPGGPTNQGITLGVYAAWKGMTLNATNSAALKDELRRIDADTVREIYRRRYWAPSRAAELPPGAALMHFDASVNHGVGAAARMLQEAARTAIDGEIGPETITAAGRTQERDLVERYAEIRRARYRQLPHFWRFGRGWLRRTDVTLSRAAAISRSEPTETEPITPSSNEKGSTHMEITAGTTAPKWWGQSMTIWGAIITALATVAPAVGPVIGVDISGEIIRQAGGQAAQVFQAIAGLAGTVLTIWGRVRATQPLQQREVSFKF